MAGERYRQLTSYASPQPSMASHATANRYLTWNFLLRQAAMTQYGENIFLRDSAVTDKQLRDLKESIALKILNRENEPREVGRSIVDITTKDYINNATTDGKAASDRDTTKASVTKWTGTTAVRNYQFITNEGLIWSMNASAGLQVLAMGTVGNSMSAGAFFDENRSTRSTTEDALSRSLGFTYNQEEEISVPPGKRVHVKVTTYSVHYNLQYTLEFRVPRALTVQVSYSTPYCCNACIDYRTGHVYASNIVRTLPGFREDDVYAYYTQNGVLSWIGESCSVEKNEYPIQQVAT